MEIGHEDSVYGEFTVLGEGLGGGEEVCNFVVAHEVQGCVENVGGIPNAWEPGAVGGVPRCHCEDILVWKRIMKK